MDLVIRNTRLIDCTGAEAVHRVSMQVDDGLISWIGEETARPQRHVHREDINGEGLTLIPGMIDCHEHFTGDGGMENMDHLLGDTQEEFTLKAVGNCRRALMSGVTSARDVGARFGINILIARETAAGAVLGPRIIAAGEWLQFPGTWPPALTRRTETVEELVIAIREQIANGTGLVKVGATGFRANGEQFGSLGPAALDAAVKTAHCHGFEGSHQAVEAGVDSIEHGTYVDEETVRLMAARGTYFVPTMSTWDTRIRVGTQLGMAKALIEETLDRRENSGASFRRAMRAGVNIAAGTDAGGCPARHGFIAREIELMVDAGMTPEAALESATRQAANLLGIHDKVGTIEVGKQADMVLIDGDPHSDPGALRKVWAVFQGGRRIR